MFEKKERTFVGVIRTLGGIFGGFVMFYYAIAPLIRPLISKLIG